MKSVFDSSFKYTPSLDTCVRKTFERVCRKQRQVRGRLAVVKSQPETKKSSSSSKRPSRTLSVMGRFINGR
jgi:hypothetical protein